MNYPFDIELFKNFFSMVAKNPYTGKEYVWYSFENKDCRPQLKKFLDTKPTLIGFNSYSYDLPVLAYYCNHSLEETHNFSQMIISSKRHERKPKEYYDCRDRNQFDGIDLMRVLSLDGSDENSMRSLKQCAVNIGWPKIQELPFDPHQPILKHQISDAISYNKNDVNITNALYDGAVEDIELRQYILDEYGVDVFNKSESHTANALMTNLYCHYANIPYLVLKEQRTLRPDTLNVIDCIGKNVEFVSDEMKRFYDSFKQMSFVVKQDKSLEVSLFYKGNRYNVGLGGLHSIDEPGRFDSTDKVLLYGDIRSNYPAIILENRIKPAHLDDVFYDVFGNLVKLRTDAKDAGDKLKARALKIVINSVFGKMNYDSFWLYDPLAFYQVTITGQLYLLSLLDLLEFNDIDVISANTDGIIVYTDKVDLFYDLCYQWQHKTKMNIDFDKWQTYIRRDGNSYLAIAENGKMKTKGMFFDITDTSNHFQERLKRQFKYPIVTKALHKFFINKESIEDTIRNHKSLYDFCMVQKPGKKFSVYFNGQKTQRINRIYVSTSGGRLMKIANGQKLSVIDDEVSLANDIIDDSIPNDLDFNFYIKEAMKIVNKIQPPAVQGKLF